MDIEDNYIPGLRIAKGVEDHVNPTPSLLTHRSNLRDHRVVERDMDRMVCDDRDSNFLEVLRARKRLMLAYMEDKMPTFYKMLRKMGVSEPYPSPYS